MNNYRSLLVPVFILLLCTTSIFAQIPRNNYNARLEMDNAILHGAGQEVLTPNLNQ